MTTLEDRSEASLIVIDVQNDVVAGAFGRDEVVANIRLLVDRSRAAGVAVVWVQHSDAGMVRGSEEWALVPELAREDTEALVHKQYGDAFEATDLEAVLSAAHVGKLIVVGAETDACIRSTIHGAFTRGYDVTLVADAHTAGDKSEWGAPPTEAVIRHTNLYWQFHSAPGRTAAVIDTADVTFGD